MAGSGTLKKGSLNLLETIALSAAIMAPSANTAISVPLVITVAGSSVSLAFVFAIILALCLSFAILKFNRFFPSCGSLYTFTEKGLGKTAGFASGWMLAFTYLLFALGSSAAFGLYVSILLSEIGLNISWIIISLVFLAVVWVLAYRNINLSMRVMLVLEGISITLVLILVVVIFVTVGQQGQGIPLAPLQTNGNSWSVMAQGVALALVAFAGFEGASCLGEEAKNPKKNIPMTILGTVIFLGIFLMVTGYGQVIGFHLDMNAFYDAIADPLGTLAGMYISQTYATLVTLGIALSLLSCTIGCACAASRVFLGMSRDGLLHRRIAATHPKHHTPHIAVIVSMSLLVVVEAIYFFFNTGTDSTGLFLAAFGTAALSVVIAYLLTTLSGVVYFLRERLWRFWQIIIPVIAMAALVLVFVANIFPAPAFPGNLYPYLALVWLVIGFIVMFFSRRSNKAHPAELSDAGSSETGSLDETV
ncbi:MAG: APC family permease [Coriobacteriia bacterium]|nr:APC family permease [Coriobacteriia bacterium]